MCAIFLSIIQIFPRHSSSPSICQPLHRPYQQQSQIKHLGRRSKQAQMKVEKMKKAYKMAKEINASVETEPQEQQVQRNNRRLSSAAPLFTL